MARLCFDGANLHSRFATRGTHEVLAREIHVEFLRSQLAAGKMLYSKDSLHPGMSFRKI